MKSFFESKSINNKRRRNNSGTNHHYCDIGESDIEQVEMFTDNLEDLDDVQNIYTNINMI